MQTFSVIADLCSMLIHNLCSYSETAVSQLNGHRPDSHLVNGWFVHTDCLPAGRDMSFNLNHALPTLPHNVLSLEYTAKATVYVDNALL